MITLQIQSVIYKNKPKALLNALKALKQSVLVCQKRGLELNATIVYGDASDSPVLSEDNKKEIIDYLDDTIKFEYQIFGFNSGTANGHNLLGKECSSDYMMIMNPDVILEPRCLFELFKPFQNIDVGLTEARQTPLEHAKEYNIKTGETEWASTACALFKTELFHKIKGFDADSFFMYCDDLDFSWRIRLLNKKIYYVPSAIIYHSKKLSLNASWEPTAAEVYYSAEAAILLAYKWSNFERVEKLCDQYKNIGGISEKKAVKEFEKRKQENKLPTPIKNGEKVARFLDDDYCNMRFHYR